jgi:hypothetical protein
LGLDLFHCSSRRVDARRLIFGKSNASSATLSQWLYTNEYSEARSCEVVMVALGNIPWFKTRQYNAGAAH